MENRAKRPIPRVVAMTSFDGAANTSRWESSQIADRSCANEQLVVFALAGDAFSISIQFPSILFSQRSPNRKSHFHAGQTLTLSIILLVYKSDKFLFHMKGILQLFSPLYDRSY